MSSMGFKSEFCRLGAFLVIDGWVFCRLGAFFVVEPREEEEDEDCTLFKWLVEVDASADETDAGTLRLTS